MDNRFFNLFGLSEDEAIALLKTPLEELEDGSDRYIAASHLVNFPTQRSIQALIETIEDPDPEMYHRIARRKAIETLGRLQAEVALPTIRKCLADEDRYTVENAVWAIGEIGTKDEEILEEIARLLDLPNQSHRVIIQTLAKLDYPPALERIKKYTQAENEPLASAAISAVARFTRDYSQIDRVVNFLQHSSVDARRACIQDLIDSKYYQAIPQISKCPVSIVFRLRGIKLLGESGIKEGAIAFSAIAPHLDNVIRDFPDTLELVHEYDEKPSLEFLISDLYNTDFGRCYLATQTLLKEYPHELGEALLATYEKSAYNDYGAHYHVIKLLGWLKYTPGYNIVLEALNNKEPQFQKSRGAAALALANFGDFQAIPLLKEALNTRIFDLKYASLLALEQLGDLSGASIVAEDSELLIREKARTYL